MYSSSFRNNKNIVPASPVPINKEDILKLKQLIESIEADPNAEPFLEPVRWQGK